MPQLIVTDCLRQERLAKTPDTRRVEEEAADVTARLHRDERQFVNQKSLLEEDM